MRALLISLVLGVALVGCADHIEEPRGTSIEVIPVTYQFKLTETNQAQFAERLSTFIEKHPTMVTRAEWKIQIAGTHGDSLYQSAKRQLIEAGVDSNRIVYFKHQKSGQFKIEVAATVHQVKLEICHQERVGEYGRGSLGCNTDTSRWQSMVNPQNAI